MPGRYKGLLIGAALLASGAIAAGATMAAGNEDATVRQLMLGIVIPASDGVFGVASKAPENDIEWEVIEADAMVLAEAGRLLTQDGRAKDHGDWAKYAKDLVDASLTTARYARAKDVDKVIDAGNTVYDSCDSCHMKYLPERVGN